MGATVSSRLLKFVPSVPLIVLIVAFVDVFPEEAVAVVLEVALVAATVVTVVATAVVAAPVVVAARRRILGSGPLCHVMSPGPFIIGPQANL